MTQEQVLVVIVRVPDDVWFDINSDPYTSEYVIAACRRDPSREKDFFHYPDHRTFSELKKPLGLA